MYCAPRSTEDKPFESPGNLFVFILPPAPRDFSQTVMSKSSFGNFRRSNAADTDPVSPAPTISNRWGTAISPFSLVNDIISINVLEILGRFCALSRLVVRVVCHIISTKSNKMFLRPADIPMNVWTQRKTRKKMDIKGHHYSSFARFLRRNLGLWTCFAYGSWFLWNL